MGIASNAEIVERVLDHWSRLEPLPREILHEEIEFVNAPDAIEPGTRHGLSGFDEAGSAFGRAYSALDFEIERRLEAGDSVGMIVRMHLTGRGSGIEMDERMGWLFTLREGKLLRFEWSRDPEALLSRLAAG